MIFISILALAHLAPASGVAQAARQGKAEPSPWDAQMDAPRPGG